MKKLSYYHRLEADYLKKIEIWWLKKNGWLKLGSTHHNITVSWGKGENNSSIGLDISLLTSMDEVEERNIQPSDIDKYVRFTYTQTDPKGNEKDLTN